MTPLNTPQRPCSRRPHPAEGGFVLVVVLIIIAIITTLVVDMIYFTRIDHEIALNTRDDIRSTYIAKSGVNIVAGAMKDNSLEELTDLATTYGAQGGDSDGFWTIKVPYFPLGELGGVSIAVLDERSKINLNALVNPKTNIIDQQVKVQLEELFRFLEIDQGEGDSFIASLINWLDGDLHGTQNDQYATGATAGFYRSLEFPYEIKDGPLDSLEEIKMVDGMNEGMFAQLRDYLTIYPRDKKVNFSTAPRVVIMAVLKSAMVSAVEGQGTDDVLDLKDDVAEDMADAIIEERAESSVVTRNRTRQIVRDIDATLNIAAGLSGVVLATGKSDTFSVNTVGTLGFENPTIKVVDAVLRKRQQGTGPRIRIVSWKQK